MKHAIKKTGLYVATAIALAFGCASAAQAATVSWTDWTNTSAAASQVFGDLDINGAHVGVTFTGAYAFAQTTGAPITGRRQRHISAAWLATHHPHRTSSH